jgi:hypothetical protein
MGALAACLAGIQDIRSDAASADHHIRSTNSLLFGFQIHDYHGLTSSQQDLSGTTPVLMLARNKLRTDNTVHQTVANPYQFG